MRKGTQNGVVMQAVVGLQACLGAAMNDLARETGCVERERKFSGSALLEMLVLTLLQNPAAKDGDYLTVANQLNIDVTQQAIRKRFDSSLVEFLKAALEHILEQCVCSTSTRSKTLLQKFKNVTIGDSSTISLPDELADLFPGCGGSGEGGKAALKIQVALSLTTGKMTVLIEPGRASDAKSAITEASPPKETLSIWDLGYFSLERFRSITEANAFWISRLQHGTHVFNEAGRRLKVLPFLGTNAPNGLVDLPVVVGEHERLACRLIAVRAPQDVVARRRRRIRDKARDRGREPSKEYLKLQEWSIFITNCAPAQLTWKEVVVLYRARWQIEILFKLWKSHNQLDVLEIGASLDRQMAVFYAKFIGVIVQHWLLVMSVWDNPSRSLLRAGGMLRKWIPLLIEVLNDSERLANLLERIQLQLFRNARVTKRRKRPSLFQLLENPGLLEYNIS